MGVDEQERVATLAAHHAAGEDLHQVGLAHARGGEDAHVAGQALARDADLEVDDRLAAAQMADGQVAHARAQEVEVGGLGSDDARELRGQALRLPELGEAWSEVTEAPAGGDAIGAARLLVERVQARLVARVVGEQRARLALGPPGLAVFCAVGDVDDTEQVAPAGVVVDADEDLAEEQVFVGRGPENALEHVLAEQPAPCVRRVPQALSLKSGRSAKARSRTSRGTPARSKSSSSCMRTSARSQGGQAASRSATVSG